MIRLGGWLGTVVAPPQCMRRDKAELPGPFELSCGWWPRRLGVAPQALASMRMWVMNIRIVRVPVFELIVHMSVQVGLFSVPLGIVTVLMMLIVKVRMLVLQTSMTMPVHVMFCQMQPQARAHEQRRHDQQRRQRRSQCYGERGTNERRQ